jgi:hypothetical protein
MMGTSSLYMRVYILTDSLSDGTGCVGLNPGDYGTIYSTGNYSGATISFRSGLARPSPTKVTTQASFQRHIEAFVRLAHDALSPRIS